ncbi:MAG: hypothetical protein ABW194_08960 [Novosphingobium sp.]
MRTIVIAAAGGLALAAALPAPTAFAQTAADPENVKPEDVAMSPFSDVGLHKKVVPVVLEAAMAKPYDLAGITSCAGLTTAIMDLDVALGDDIDVVAGKSDEEKMGNSAGVVAKSLIGSFIPFRGVIRELSGANANQRLWERALYAGAARRAFLKGMGEHQGCAWPARSATPDIVARLAADREALRLAKKAPKEKTAGAPVQVSFETTPAVEPSSRR